MPFGDAAEMKQLKFFTVSAIEMILSLSLQLKPMPAFSTMDFDRPMHFGIDSNTPISAET